MPIICTMCSFIHDHSLWLVYHWSVIGLIDCVASVATQLKTEWHSLICHKSGVRKHKVDMCFSVLFCHPLMDWMQLTAFMYALK